MRFLYDNRFDEYDIYDYSTEDGSFPVENTQNIKTDVRWHTTGCTSEYVTMDTGTSADVLNTFVISNHNLTSGATINIQIDGVDTFAHPSLNANLAAGDWREDHIIYFFANNTERYVKITIADAANPDGYISIGRIFIGRYLQVDPSSLLEFPIANERNDLITETDTGGVYATPGIILRRFNYSFPDSDQDMIDDIRDFNDVCGNYKPFYLLNFNTDWTDIAPAYVRMVSAFSENRKGSFSTYSLELKEVI